MRLSLALFMCGLLAMLLTGCEQAQEKKILEIKTPGTSIEVRKSDDGAKVNVDRKP